MIGRLVFLTAVTLAACAPGSLIAGVSGNPYEPPAEELAARQAIVDTWPSTTSKAENKTTTTSTTTTRPPAITLGLLVSQHFYPADQDLMLRIAFCESSAQPADTYSTAHNSSSGAAGWFQHLPKFWEERTIAAGIPDADPYDPRSNVRIAAYLYYNTPGGVHHWDESSPCWS
jgi:hypothetical protein